MNPDTDDSVRPLDIVLLFGLSLLLGATVHGIGIVVLVQSAGWDVLAAHGMMVGVSGVVAVALPLTTYRYAQWRNYGTIRGDSA